MSIRTAIGQVNPRLGDLQANLALYGERIGRAAADKASLWLFPEMYHPRSSMFDPGSDA